MVSLEDFVQQVANAGLPADKLAHEKRKMGLWDAGLHQGIRMGVSWCGILPQEPL